MRLSLSILFCLCFLACLRTDYVMRPEGYLQTDLRNLSAEEMTELRHVAKKLSQQAKQFGARGQYEHAERYYRNAIYLFQGIFGDETLDAANGFIELADVFLSAQNPQAARDAARSAEKLLERRTQAKSNDSYRQFMMLGSVYERAGQYQNAVKSFTNALRTLPGEEPQVSVSANITKARIAWNECAVGDCDEVGDRLKIAIQSIPDSSSEYLPELISLYRKRIRLSRAGENVDGIEAIVTGAMQRLPEERKCEIMELRLDLAEAYLAEGRLSETEALLRKITGEEVFQSALHDISPGEYHWTADYSVREWKKGEKFDGTGVTFVRMAGDHMSEGIPDSDIDRPIAIRPCLSDSSNAKFLHTLGRLREEQGNYHQAANAFGREVLLTLRSHSRDESPEIASRLVGSLQHQIVSLVSGGRDDDAISLLWRTLNLMERNLQIRSLWFSDREYQEYIDSIAEFDVAMLTIRKEHADSHALNEAALASHILHHNRNTDELVRRHAALTQLRTSIPLQEQLGEIKRLTAALAASQQRSGRPTSQMEPLAQQLQVLEDGLLRRLAGYRRQAAPRNAPQLLELLRQQLRRDSALIVYARYADTEACLSCSERQPYWRYVAFALLPSGHVRAVELGPAAGIEEATKRLWTSLLHPENKAYQQHSLGLYSLVFEKVLRWLPEGTRRIQVVPDGQLSMLPFHLLDTGDSLLGDQLDISYLGSALELLPRPPSEHPDSSILVLADPDFAMTASAASRPLRIDEPSSHPVASQSEEFWALERGRGCSLLPEHLRGLKRLPWARAEAEALGRLFPWQAKVRIGDMASERVLLGLSSSPLVLHLATHGCFLGAADAPNRRSALLPLLPTASLPKLPENPLLHSTLFFAGAGADPWLAGDGETTVDGITSGMEIAKLPLHGTRLVTLSSCESALGTYKEGHGVMGLPRSFLIAGAESVVASLWPVDDKATSELMQAFYYRLRMGMGRAEALRDASAELRGRYPHPFYWGSFVLIGQDGPIPELTQTTVR